MRAILGSLGYKSADIDSADDPTNGLSELKKARYTALFVYRDMPKMSGLQIIQEVRATSRLKSLPIVIYSGEVSREIVMEAVQGGASGFLGYPFSVSDVESALKTAIKNAPK